MAKGHTPTGECVEHSQSYPYGRIRHRGRNRPYHLVVYERTTGDQVPPGMHVDHLCSNPRCINPDHLEVVTPAENTRRASSTKLTVEQVAEIRRLAEWELARRVAAGYRRRTQGWQDEMAERYGVTRDNIKHIVRRESWAD